MKNWIVKKILEFTGSQKFLSIQLDITNRCNLNCRHCYQTKHSGGEDLCLEDWSAILDQYGKLLARLHLNPHFCVSGGEPTSSPLFIPVLAGIHNRWPGAGIIVLTNGTRISDVVISEMVRHKTDVQISVDGPDRDRHDEIRGKGNFDLAMQGVALAKEQGLRVILQAVLSVRTAGWITEFFDLAGNLKVNAMNFTRFVPQGSGKLLHKSGLDSPLCGNALRDAYHSIVTAARNSGVPTVTSMPLFVLVSPELGAHGKFGFQGLVIDHKGNLKVSSRTDFVLGNVLDKGLEELFLTHPVMEDLRAGKIEVCGSCALYPKCGGDRNASFAATGSFLKKDPGCWL